MIDIRNYPELQLLCWNIRHDIPLESRDAYALYKRLWRFVEVKGLTDAEKALIRHLVATEGDGAFEPL